MIQEKKNVRCLTKYTKSIFCNKWNPEESLQVTLTTFGRNFKTSTAENTANGNKDSKISTVVCQTKSITTFVH